MIDHIIAYDRSATVEEETSATLGVRDEGTWIDIGDHDLAKLSEIAAISRSDDNDARHLANKIERRVDLVRTVLHMKDGSLLGCALSWREVRNRLRKCRHVIV